MGLKAVEGNSLACGTLYAATTPTQTQPGGGAQGARERPPAGTDRLGAPRALHVPHHHLGGAERQRCPLISANTSLAQGTGQANLPSLLQTGRRERRLRAGERLRHREQAHARAAGGTRVSLKRHQYELTSRTSSHKTIHIYDPGEKASSTAHGSTSLPGVGTGGRYPDRWALRSGSAVRACPHARGHLAGALPRWHPAHLSSFSGKLSSACPAACYRRCRRLNGAPLASPAGSRLGSYFNCEMLLPPVTQTW